MEVDYQDASNFLDEVLDDITPSSGSGTPGPPGADGADGADGLPRFIADEGITLTQRDTMDFQGEGVTATDDPTHGKTVISIPITDKTYVHTQVSPSASWIVNHNLNKYPAVEVIDSGGNVVIADVTYLTINSIEVTFASATSGKVYVN